MKKIISFALIFTVMIGFALPLSGGGAKAAENDELFLYVGSPIAMSKGKTLPIDSQNPDLAPFIHMDRTLVPLRFVSEFFGADVSYDAAQDAGVVKINGKTAVFPVGASYYLLDGERVELDTESLRVSDRIFLPLRSLCEIVLELEVDYDDNVIFIAGKAELTEVRIQEVKNRIGMYIKATSLDALKNALSSGGYWSGEGDIVDDEESPPMSPPPAEAPGDSALPEEEKDHSDTNTQVDGVDEADIIKTDGKYIYLLSNNRLTIVSAQGSMSVVAQIDMDKDRFAGEMYVDNGRLVIIGGCNNYNAMTDLGDAMLRPYGSYFTFVNVYDISDLDNISILRSFEIEGSHVSSRRQGDYVYLLSNEYVWYTDGDDPRPLLGENGELCPMPVEDILIMPGRTGSGFTTLSAINIRDTSEKVESESIVGGGYVTYMSNNAMYVAAEVWSSDGENLLNIARFSVNGGKIGYAGTGIVTGYLNDQFSMDEHKGFLRVATTDWGRREATNNLFVLDENMQICGSVLGFAPDETIYSARFMGDRGYVVTFRQVDPLFVFDLSDPANPKITGELKVPGFSSYLHPVSENVILGIGQDVKDVYVKDQYGNEVVVGQQTGGIKLSLFDVSDMGRPKEIDNLIIGDRGYAGVLYNHKAAMFKKDGGTLAFSAELYSPDYKETWMGAVVVSYLNNRLVELGRIAAHEAQSDGYMNYYEHRLVYIGDTLYYAQNNTIRSFDLTTLSLKQILPI